MEGHGWWLGLRVRWCGVEGSMGSGLWGNMVGGGVVVLERERDRLREVVGLWFPGFQGSRVRATAGWESIREIPFSIIISHISALTCLLSSKDLTCTP
ncbi:hypothetical protein E2C01_057968 [Portunus trituberculatus]|uniref:Uncharacterized protein n=1 Tax=Portunus trituberculatus TaxID=210409 RepID=A0A5B7GUD7_PORTR|nr:hypothetical protein [Portunus trituberculatus]